MFKTIWFLIKLGLFTALAIWLLRQEGDMSFSWQDYQIETSIGIAGLAGLVFLLALINLIRIGEDLARIPAGWRRKKEKSALENGIFALERAFSALSAGDGSQAEKETRRAGKLLGKENGLVLLSTALTARQQDNLPDAHQAYTKLMNAENTAFLGLRGLLQLKKNEGDLTAAIGYAREAEKLYPQQGWIIKALYDMECEARHWDKALLLLEKLRRQNVMADDLIRRDKAALYVMQARRFEDPAARKDLLDHALKADPNFLPAVKDAIAFYSSAKGNIRKARHLFEKQWRSQPHPSLLAFWPALMPRKDFKKLAKKPGLALAWAEKLLTLNNVHPLSYIAAAEAAIDLRLYSQARDYLRKAESLQPTKKLYECWSALEKAENGNDDAARAWQDKAMQAKPDETWVCRETGLVQPRWSPLIEPYHLFNTLEWRRPEEGKKHIGIMGKPAGFEEDVLRIAS